jgi:arylsulfatase A-like enzyme
MNAPHWAAGPLVYAAVMVVLAKLGRAAELAERLDSARPFLLVPAVLGQDVVLVAAIGLLGLALGRLRRPRVRLGLTLLLLLPIALLLPADVVAHLLTGKPITFQRLRGDEGATLGDLGLIDQGDLIGGCAAIAVALAGMWPALRYAPRARWLRRFCRPRALLIMLLAGFAVSLVQGALLPRTQGLSDQPVFVLLQSLTERNALTGVALSDRRWRELHEPGVKVTAPRAPRVGEPEPRNVVIFLAEGIPFEATGFNPEFAAGKVLDRKRRPLPNPTPHLTRRHARHGLVFERYYANWHASIQAIFSVVCSAFPPLGGDIVRIKPRIDCGEMSEVLAAHDVRSGLFHGGRFNFYNKLALLGRRDYRIELDAEELAKTSQRATHQWGIDDRAVADAVLAWVDSLPREQRFAALIIPITAHYPYWTPSDFKPPFQARSRRERFLNGVAFQDQVFEEMLRGFEKRGRYDDTLFVWLGDHGHYVSEPERITPGLREFYEPNLHTPLVLINPRMFPPSLPAAERTSARLGSHVDLLPTLLGALGLPPEPRHQGQDLLGADFRPQRVFIGAEDGKYLGFLEGTHKFVVETRTRRTEYYDLAKDPDELVDLSPRHTERMIRYTEDAIAFARGAQARIDAAEVLPEAVSVSNLYELFVTHVAAAWQHDSQRVSCGAGPRASCPGLGPLLRIDTKRMQGEKRRCVMVKVPPSGKLELRIAHRDALELLTGTIAALPGKPKGDPMFLIGAAVDGGPPANVALTRRGAVRPVHPRAERELRFLIERTGEPTADAPEVCLQLTTLFSR